MLKKLKNFIVPTYSFLFLTNYKEKILGGNLTLKLYFFDGVFFMS